jgi:hypothetical protein
MDITRVDTKITTTVPPDARNEIVHVITILMATMMIITSTIQDMTHLVHRHLHHLVPHLLAVNK